MNIPTLFLKAILIINVLSCQHPKFALIIGDWIEVRRESRLGYIYTKGGVQLTPSIKLSFNRDGMGTFYNPETPDPEVKAEYKVYTDSILFFIRVNEIVKIDSHELVLIIRAMDKLRSDHDLKCTFIRKTFYHKLDTGHIRYYKSPTIKDLQYRDSILQNIELMHR